MKCPLCKNELRRSTKHPEYLLCDNCRKRFRDPSFDIDLQEDYDDEEQPALRYANIPSKKIREKREEEMKKAYDELLAIGEEERKHKRFSLFKRRK